MGCWTETCALSHMPINAGDKVVYIFLASGKYEDGRGVYSTDYWEPYFVPILGLYDEHGGIELLPEQKPIVDYITHTINNIIAEPQTKKLSWNDIVSLVHKEKLWVKDLIQKYQLIPIMINYDVWKEFCQIEYISQWENRSHTIDKINIKTNEILNALKDKKISKSHEEFDEIYHQINQVNDLILLINLDFLNPKASIESLTQCFKQDILSEQDIELILSQLRELLFINSLFEIGRMTWHPTTGKGSQNSAEQLCLDMHLRIVNVLQDYIFKQSQLEE